METNLVALNIKVRTSVGLEKNADPKKCHELMQEYAGIDITALMLKKNPNVVETVKRLRKYIGNTRKL